MAAVPLARLLLTHAVPRAKAESVHAEKEDIQDYEISKKWGVRGRGVAG
jgi:hypothetical protein